VPATRLEGDEDVQLDGVLSEPFWSRAQPATDFLQRDPNVGSPASERTEVRIAYDEGRLLLGVMLYDDEPDQVLGNQMQRDQSLSADDRFMWVIDSFLDGRSAYFFEINPSGAMGDGLVNPSSPNPEFGLAVDKSWDGVWTARVRRASMGWTAEIEIPFRTLNFDPHATAWGINFQRTVRRKNEESLWTGYTRNQGLTRVASAGRVTGFQSLSQGIGFDLVPYVVGNVESAPGRGRSSTLSTGDMGFDAFYNVTPALRANVSINTDFAETEVDQRRVNLTRFPLQFPEKRGFFLEGSSFFDFTRERGNIDAFFSRRIGLDEHGTPQRIVFGAKLTGQAGPLDVGVLQVRTASTPVQPGEDFSVVRVKQRIFRESYFGGLYTRRAARDSLGIDRHTAGGDFELKTSHFRGNQNLAFSGTYLWTTNVVGSGKSGGYAVRLDYPNDPLSMRMFVRTLQESYDPAVGFYDRRGYQRVNPVIEYRPRPRNNRWIRSFFFSGNWNFSSDTVTYRPVWREFQYTPFAVDLHSGDHLEFEVTPIYERLEQRFEISRGIVLPPGGVYRYTRYAVRGSTSSRRVLAVSPQIEFGDFFSGRRTTYGLSVNLRPRRGISLGFEGERNVLDLAEGSFSTNLFRGLANTQFSPWLSLANTLQYDTVSRLLGWQLRFRWIQRPGNDLYVVYAHNWRPPLDRPDERLSTFDQRLATKLLYTLRF
jgi:hypothetical protein